MMSNRDNIVEVLIQPQLAQMLDIIRIRMNVDTSIELLREQMNISRSTADKLYSILNERGIVSKGTRRPCIRGEKAVFLGVSIGSLYIRTALIGLDFQPLKLEPFFSLEEASRIPGFDGDESCPESYTYKISAEKNDKLEFIRSIVSQIVSSFLNKAESDPTFPLFGIGFGVAGPVDYDAKVWRSAPRITNLNNITIADLVGFGNKMCMDKMQLFLSIDNNSKTAALSEYQYLLERTSGSYSEDLALIYLGSGIGLATIMDGKLLRGSKNMSCEIGHIQLLLRDQHETKVNDGNNSIEFVATTIEELLENDQNSENNEESLITYLPYVLNVINCMFGIRRFVLVGHSIGKNEMLTNKIMDQRIKFTVSSTQMYCSAETGRGVPYTSAIGAAMESYFTVCNYAPQDNFNERTNLAHEIILKRGV